MVKGNESPILDGSIVEEYGNFSGWGDDLKTRNNCDWATCYGIREYCPIDDTNQFNDHKLNVMRIKNCN